MAYGKLSKIRDHHPYGIELRPTRLISLGRKCFHLPDLSFPYPFAQYFQPKILDNYFRFIYVYRQNSMQRDGALEGQQGNRWNSGTDPPLCSGTKAAICHWSGTKQVGKARGVDWSDSQKTCHYVHVCGDGKSSSQNAWGFFLYNATVKRIAKTSGGL